METMTRVSAVEAQVVASQVGASSDCYIPSGQVGKVDLRHGCFSAYEVFRLAARDIVESGEAAAVSAMLRARVKTVRQFLAERYQVFTGAREYYTRSHMTADEADTRDFLRILRRAEQSATIFHCDSKPAPA